MDDAQQILVVLRVYLDQQVILSGECNNTPPPRVSFPTLSPHNRTLKAIRENTHVGTSLEANLFRINNKLRSFHHAQLNEFLHPLVYCRTGDTTFAGHLQKGYACIVNDQSQNLLINSSSSCCAIVYV